MWPRNLGGQLIVVTALAISLSNAIVVGWFTLGHQRDNDKAETYRLLDRAASTAILMSKIPADTREATLRTLSNGFMGIFALQHGHHTPVAMSAEETAISEHLRKILPPDLARLPIQVHFHPTTPMPQTGPPPSGNPFSARDMGGASGPPNGPEWGPLGPNERIPPHERAFAPNPMLAPSRSNPLEVVIPICDNTALVAFFFRHRGPFWSGPLLLAAIMTILFASLAAAFIARRISRPLSILADAANIASHGGQAPKVPVEGPEDIRRAVSAFNAMTDQVARTLESHRHLLSAVGHDLRTPITAMRINIEFVRDPELAERLVKNLDELQALTEAVLSAARGSGGEALRNVDLSALVESICTDLADLDLPVVWKGGDGATISCRTNEMRRAIRNLIENAVAYGKTAEVSLAPHENGWQVCIADQGPGIPPQDRQRVFEPFVRLENSRNSKTGGVGLGLTLAKNIIEGHNGKIEFDTREDGRGFIVRIVLRAGAA